MIPDWAQFLIYLAALFGVFVWLRNDIKSFRAESRDERKQLRDDLQGEITQLRDDMRDDMRQLREDTQDDIQKLRNDIHRLETKVDGLDSRLRAVESEQSRVAGLLEGLGLAGALPTRDE
ncbi:MAG: hypothetical protein OXG23_03835 [Chloroflexi bacterium]|nr:hypothetical protein [Chloroflexota bacterium]